MDSETSHLRQQLEKLSNDLNAILPLGIALSAEKDPDRLREKILLEARSICHADAGLLYLRTEDNLLRLAIRRSVPLRPAEIEKTTFFPPSPPLPLYDETGAPNYRNVAIPDVYETEEFDFSGTKAFDRQHNYRTISLLAIPLKDDDGNVIGVFELINAKDPATGQIGPFDSYHQMVAESLTSQTTIALKNQRLQERQAELLKFEREMQIGRQIQADFLPEQLPQVPGWEIVACFHPAREVAGDFYDAFTLSDGQIGLVIADVVDKGVGAALFMALFRSLIRFFGGQHGLGGSSALDGIRLTNDYISLNHSRSNMFATLFFGVLDPASGVLTYINGGHNPPALINAAGAIKARLKPTGPAVGMLPDQVFSSQQVILEPGDMLMTFTDGALDARDPAGKLFTEKRLLEILQQPASSATALLDRLEASLKVHIASADQFDDITMLVVRRELRVGA
jgi:sigma-B regulation protein RsbU (phosphoserine phosphatase)